MLVGCYPSSEEMLSVVSSGKWQVRDSLGKGTSGLDEIVGASLR